MSRSHARDRPSWDRRWRPVVILGPYGSGKTTLARRLGDATGLPVTHVDSLLFKPDWRKVEPSEWIHQLVT